MSVKGIHFSLNEDLFHRDPQESEYGHRLMASSILLLDELGFEKFTFKKLAVAIDSTEASIYRYFENKHMLLLFLSSWYWEWVHYLISIHLRNVTDPSEQLRIAIHNIVSASTESAMTEYVNEHVLHRVVIKESSKAYHVHEVDAENQSGHFLSYKEVVRKVATIIQEVDPKFRYPNMLASNLFEMANNQIFFAEHLPELTDISARKTRYAELEEALCFFAFRLLQHTD